MLQMRDWTIINVTFPVPSQAAIRRQLSEVEAKELLEGHDIALDDVLSPSVLIAFGMDLEAEQYVDICIHPITNKH